jgi:aminomethyltransferase
MPIPTPFYVRTNAICESREWRNWSGYLAASLYEPTHEREYYAIRNTAALIDVSPLYKYEISGTDAERLVNRIFTRDFSKCALGQVMYTPWCDDAGKVIDDGTVARLGPNEFRVTAAEANLAWFQDCAYGLAVNVRDVTTELAALALQGPHAGLILESVLQGVDLKALKYYRLAEGAIRGIPLTISRTGYTGDLGYELWISPQHALDLWDLLIEHGADFGITPAGILALDIARIEAGMIMNQVDYISSRKALIEEQKSSPFEIGLGWAVDLDKTDFIGRRALIEESRRGARWRLIGLEVNWDDLEAVFGRWDLTPQVAGRASRAAVPIYGRNRQIGQMTSHTFSPWLKRYIGIGMARSQYARDGDKVSVEVTVEYQRLKANAVIVRLPFINLPRKRA